MNTPQTRHPPNRKDTFIFPRNADASSEVSITRARGKTFRVTPHGYDSDGKPNRNQNNNITKDNIGKRNSTDETVSLKDSELISAREAVEGRKRSASASMIRDKLRERVNNNNNKPEKLLSKRSNMLVSESNRETKPSWNNNFNSKKKGKYDFLRKL